MLETVTYSHDQAFVNFLSGLLGKQSVAAYGVILCFVLIGFLVSIVMLNISHHSSDCSRVHRDHLLAQMRRTQRKKAQLPKPTVVVSSGGAKR